MSQDRLEDAFVPLRERTAPAHLRAQPVRAKRPSYRPVFMIAAGAMGVAAAVVTMWPRPASAAGLLEQAKREFLGHSLTYLILDNGKRIQIGESWHEPNKSRMESNRMDGGRFVRLTNREEGFEMQWQPDLNHLVWFDDPKEFMDAPIPTHLDPQGLAMLVKMFPGGKDLKPVAGELDGKPAQKVEIQMPGRKITLYANPGNLRLIGYEANYRFQGKAWRRELTKLDDTQPSPDVFKPIITFNGRRFDVREERERIRKQLAKPIAVRIAPLGAVEIRKVAMNSHKDLFILYTGVSGDLGEAYLPSQITDDAGGTYIRTAGFDPSGHSNRSGAHYEFDGKPLRGIMFARFGKGTPTRVTFGFRQMEAPVKGTAFKVSVAITPEKTPLLDFFPFMQMAPNGVWDLERMKASAIMFRYYNARQWPQAETWIRRTNALESKAGAREVKLAWRHIWLAEALARQGRKREAVAAIKEARRRFDSKREAHIEPDLRQWETRLGVR